MRSYISLLLKQGTFYLPLPNPCPPTSPGQPMKMGSADDVKHFYVKSAPAPLVPWGTMWKLPFTMLSTDPNSNEKSTDHDLVPILHNA